jgi:hypothetical protein
MSRPQAQSLRWRKSTASAQGNCVEVADAAESVFVRNSTDPMGPTLRFTRPEWEAFLIGVRDGQFDSSPSGAPLVGRRPR